MQLTKWVHGSIWISKVKDINWPWCKATQSQHFQTSFPEKPLRRLKPNFMWSLNGTGERNFVQMVQVTGHMTSMAAMPIYGKNMKKSSSLEPNGRWPWKFFFFFFFFFFCCCCYLIFISEIMKSHYTNTFHTCIQIWDISIKVYYRFFS